MASIDLCKLKRLKKVPDSKVHGANMGSIWGRQDPGGPHVGPMNFAISGVTGFSSCRIEHQAITQPNHGVQIDMEILPNQ